MMTQPPVGLVWITPSENDYASMRISSDYHLGCGYLAAYLEAKGIRSKQYITKSISPDEFARLVISDGVKRYSELQRQIPDVTKKMLTQTLRTLERDGLVERTVYPVVPPKTEYRLTPLGLRFLEPIAALAEWAKSHQKDLMPIFVQRNGQRADAKPGM